MLAGFGQEYGLDKDTAVRLGRGLGMGMGLGLTCGAVSGALIVLGLAAGPALGNDREPRFRCYGQGAEFARRFTVRHGSLACRDLMGVEMTTAEGRQQAREGGLFASVCAGLVKSAAEILAEMLPAGGGGGDRP